MSRLRCIAAGIAVALLAAGCDMQGDEPITTTDVGVLAEACKANGGMKQAERVRPIFKHREWRIDCADGARFVIPEA
jgi:hypothetical protein